MVQNTPTPHNSTLYISPMINKKNEMFVTPPNPSLLQPPKSNKLFDSPNSTKSSFFNLDRTSNHNNNNSKDSMVDPLTPVEKLRLWRHDALMQHQYKTSEFIGDKILQLTKEANDAFWLSQVYFMQGNYLRCKELIRSDTKYEKSISCRYIAGFALIKLELWDDALDLIGEENPYRKESSNEQMKFSNFNDDGGIKLESSMCYLRGLIYSNLNNFERAKECYKEALMVDVKCFEAFNELISNNLMSPVEEWEFISSLNFRELDTNDELIKLLYFTKLNKYMNVEKFKDCEQILIEEYDLKNNIDLLISKSDYYYLQCDFDQCLKICEFILSKDEFNFDILPNYLSCLYELNGRNKLFLKSHQLVEQHPSHPLTFLSIGTYYLSINKIIEARKFFNKATILNSNFGQAWIGFAHTFAIEGEHEQAISAYAFASKLFSGTHLPNLFLGMQHLQMNNLNLAEEYLLASYNICSFDPLLLNELGVINFHKCNFDKSEYFFKMGLKHSKYLNSNSKTWISIHSNLGHIYRKMNLPYKALECFQQVLKISNKNDSNILSAMGLIYLKLGEYHKCIDILHDAIAISPMDPIATDLLKRALEANGSRNFDLFNKIDLVQLEKNSTTLMENLNKRVKNDKFLTPLKREDKKKMQPNNNNNNNNDNNNDNSNDSNDNNDVTLIAQTLQRGELSSDEEDEVMDIESD